MPLNNPSNVMAWATSADRGGAWSVGGMASDGTDAFVATGNTVRRDCRGEAARRSCSLFLTSHCPAGHRITGRPLIGQVLMAAITILAARGRCSWMCPAPRPSNLVVALGKDQNALSAQSHQPWRNQRADYQACPLEARRLYKLRQPTRRPKGPMLSSPTPITFAPSASVLPTRLPSSKPGRRSRMAAVHPSLLQRTEQTTSSSGALAPKAPSGSTDSTATPARLFSPGAAPMS